MPEKTTNQLVKQLMEAVHCGMMVVQDEYIVEINKAARELLGLLDIDIIDTPFLDIVDSMSRRHDKSSLDRLLSEESIEKFHTRLLSSDKKTIHVELNPVTIEYDGDNAILISILDLSKEIHFESEIADLRMKNKTLHDMSPGAYFTLDRECVIQSTNKAVETLLGCSEDSVIGRPLSDFIPDTEEGYSPSENILREVLQGKMIRGIEIQMMRDDGKNLWVNISARALDTSSERPSQIALLASDVTRHHAAEMRLREESNRANLYLEIMTNDLNIIHHNALFSIENLKIDEELPDDHRAILEDTSWNIRRASRLIANMRVLLALRYSAPDKRKTDLYNHINRAIIESDRDFEHKKIEVESNITEGVFEVAGHAFLWNVFFNILHNSMMYDSSQNVRVNIQAIRTDDGEMIRLEFTDFGPGMSVDLKQKAFKRHDLSENESFGRGLGLTVVDRYVAKLGGKVWIEDRVPGNCEQGVKVVLLLPVWDEGITIPPILFYKAEHCIFCGPVLESLVAILDEMNISRNALEVIDIEDTEAGVSEDELPALPTIRLGIEQLTGFVSEEDLRASIMKMIMTSGT